jgi:hypothetical protein
LSSALAAFGKAARKAINETNWATWTRRTCLPCVAPIDKWLWFVEAHLYLPLEYNDGRPIPESRYVSIQQELLNRFGGVTSSAAEIEFVGKLHSGSEHLADRDIHISFFLDEVGDIPPERFFPKGTDFAMVRRKHVKAVEGWLNHRPRVILKFQTPAEVFRSDIALKP